MPKFKVHFEASAAIGIEIEVEAKNRDEAEIAGAGWFIKNQQLLETAADEIFCAPDQTVKAYAETINQPITYMTMELDEAGFELVDTFEEGH
jgi:hypothetical protein